jgi:hypothetical protein
MRMVKDFYNNWMRLEKESRHDTKNNFVDVMRSWNSEFMRQIMKAKKQDDF